MGSTPSPTPPEQFHHSSNDSVFRVQLFWFSLSLALLLVYIAGLRFAPGLFLLRGPAPSERSLAAVVGVIKRVLSQNEASLIEQCGLDAYLIIRLVRFCLCLLAFYTVAGLLFLAPLYHAQHQSEKCRLFCEHERDPEENYLAVCVCGFVDQCSMANVPPESHALWACALAMAYMSVVTTLFLRWEYKEVVRIRQTQFESRPPRLYTVFVDRIPRSLATHNALVQYFEMLFPGQIMRVEIVGKVNALQGIADQRAEALRCLERALAVRDATGESPRHWQYLPLCGGGGSKRVDSIEFYTNELTRLNNEYCALRTHAMEEDLGDGPRQAFVTFYKVTPAAFASQALVHAELAVKPAPDPEDVRWNSLGLRTTAFSHFVRKVTGRVLFGFLVLFWGALTSLVGAVMSAEALSRQFESLGQFLVSHPDVAQWLDRLTTLVYVGLIALVYPLIAVSVKIEVRIAQSNVDRATSERFFLFLIVQVFVFYSIAGSVFKSVVDIAQNPSHIVRTLASTIPKNAAFFISFISVKVFWVYFDLLRGYNFIFAALRRCIWGKSYTPREWASQHGCCCFELTFPSPVNLAMANANLLLVFFIATSYAPVQPLMLIAAVVYFASMLLALTLVFSTSSKQMYDSGGTYWTHNFYCLAAAIVTSQLTLVGTLLTKNAFAPALVVLGCVAVTAAFAAHVQDKYRAAASDISVEICSRLDDHAPLPVELRPARIAHGHKTEGEEYNGPGPVTYQYTHPVLQEEAEESVALKEGYRLVTNQ